ncbi:MAG: tyrosine-type recombinase/integrase [Nitrospirae bacterium]|nr:tyrosine-type recombinase/integrase [Nitrospirota bacterium]
MEGPICHQCGYHKCYIDLRYNGKQYRFRKARDGYHYDYLRAQRQLNVFRSEIDNKTFNPDDYLTAKIKERLMENKLYEWLDQKSEEEQANELSPETLRHYASYAKHYYAPNFKGLDVKEVEFHHLEAFKDKLAKKKLKIKTRRNILNGLHSFFTWLKRKGIIKEVPNFPQIKGDDATMRVALDVEQQAEGLAKIPAEHRDIIEFAFEVGLRGGELTALKVKDVNLRNGTLLVQRTFSKGKLRETTKTHVKRFLPLSDTALVIAEKNMQGKTPEAFLFIDKRTKRHYTQNILWYNWHYYSGTGITFYEATRHSFISQLVEDDANPFVAQVLARHTDIRTTQKYYHATSAKLRNQVNSRGKVVKLGKPKTGTEPERH